MVSHVHCGEYSSIRICESCSQRGVQFHPVSHVHCSRVVSICVCCGIDLLSHIIVLQMAIQFHPVSHFQYDGHVFYEFHSPFE